MFTALWVRQWKFLVQIQIWWIFFEWYNISFTKTWTARLWNMKFMKTKQAIPKKNILKLLFLQSSPSSWNVQFRDYRSTGPWILFKSFLQPAWIDTGSIGNPSSAVGCVQLVLKYILKVKLYRGQSPNIFSEIIIPRENGRCGGNIPIFYRAWPIVHWLSRQESLRYVLHLKSNHLFSVHLSTVQLFNMAACQEALKIIAKFRTGLKLGKSLHNWACQPWKLPHNWSLEKHEVIPIGSGSPGPSLIN